MLDDDESIHQVWSNRFSRLMESYSSIKKIDFYQPDELLKFHTEQITRENLIYFIDYELIGSQKTGLDIIAELDIAKQSYLVTSRYEDEAIRNRCIELGVKIIPKPYSVYISIEINKNNPDVILIDNDTMVIDTWTLIASLKDKIFAGFTNPQDFLRKSAIFLKTTPIYIDSDLGIDIKGEEFAKKLYELGFQNLYLCTGHDASHFEQPLPWIKAIVGKHPPF